MTLGEIIKEYVDEHSMSDFVKQSGISRAYVYMLIANKNNKGEPITPSLDTIQKVANGMNVTFDEVFNKLDYDFNIHLGGEKSPTANHMHFHILAQKKHEIALRKRKNLIELSEDEHELIAKYRKVDEVHKKLISNAADLAVAATPTIIPGQTKFDLDLDLETNIPKESDKKEEK